jgi:hypothetical protein
MEVALDKMGYESPTVQCHFFCLGGAPDGLLLLADWPGRHPVVGSILFREVAVQTWGDDPREGRI